MREAGSTGAALTIQRGKGRQQHRPAVQLHMSIEWLTTKCNSRSVRWPGTHRICPWRNLGMTRSAFIAMAALREGLLLLSVCPSVLSSLQSQDLPITFTLDRCSALVAG